jgi:hypothetical protein
MQLITLFFTEKLSRARSLFTFRSREKRKKLSDDGGIDRRVVKTKREVFLLSYRARHARTHTHRERKRRFFFSDCQVNFINETLHSFVSFALPYCQVITLSLSLFLLFSA